MVEDGVLRPQSRDNRCRSAVIKDYLSLKATGE